MRVVTLSGSGADRGRAYGESLAQEIRSAANALKAHLRSAGHDPDTLAARMAAGPLVDVTRTHLPDLWAETEAMAAASEVGLPDACLLSFLDEVWGLTRAGCSVIARRTDSGTEIGQTMDLPDWTIGRLIVLRVQPAAGAEQVVMSYPGDIGLCGASTRIGVAVNALEQFGTSEDGVAVAYILRHLLTLSSVAEAGDFLQSIPHAAGQAFTVADATSIATFEAGPGVFRRVSEPTAAACLHTNHPLDLQVREHRSTSIRLASLEQSVEAHESIERTLSGEVVLDGERYRDPNSTFAAFAYASGAEDVRFIDGIDLRAGSDDWASITFR